MARLRIAAAGLGVAALLALTAAPAAQAQRLVPDGRGGEGPRPEDHGPPPRDRRPPPPPQRFDRREGDRPDFAHHDFDHRDFDHRDFDHRDAHYGPGYGYYPPPPVYAPPPPPVYGAPPGVSLFFNIP